MQFDWLRLFEQIFLHNLSLVPSFVLWRSLTLVLLVRMGDLCHLSWSWGFRLYTVFDCSPPPQLMGGPFRKKLLSFRSDNAESHGFDLLNIFFWLLCKVWNKQQWDCFFKIISSSFTKGSRPLLILQVTFTLRRREIWVLVFPINWTAVFITSSCDNEPPWLSHSRMEVSGSKLSRTKVCILVSSLSVNLVVL